MVRHDYLTVLRTVDGSAANKRLSVKDGALVKEAAANLSEYIAQTRYVGDQADMLALLREVAGRTDMCITSGYFPDAPDGEFRIVSQKRLKKLYPELEGDDLRGFHDHPKHGPVVCRLKANMLPSTWVLFDRDVVANMPEHLATLDETQWIEKMSTIAVGLEDAGIIRVPSSTGRAVVEGKRYEAGSAHYWVQVERAEDVALFGHRLLMQGFAQPSPLSFKQPIFAKSDPDTVISHRSWSIFDPSVFSCERLVFAGAPEVSGGVELLPPDVEVMQVSDARLDTEKTRALAADQAAAVLAKFNVQLDTRNESALVANRSGGARVGEVKFTVLSDVGTLTLDTEIPTKDKGKMTVGDYWKSTEGKLRSQAVFRRDSVSWNGFLARHRDGTPFLYDNGACIRYDLDPKEVSKFRVKAARTRIMSFKKKLRRDALFNEMRHLPAVDHDDMRAWAIRKKIVKGIREFEKVLKLLRQKWEAEEAQAAQTNGAEDRTPIIWNPDALGDLTDEAMQAAAQDERYSPLFSFNGSVVSVVGAMPATAREIRERYESNPNAADSYHAGVVIQPLDRTKLALRLQKSCIFLRTQQNNPFPKTVLPPEHLVNAGVEAGASKLPSLAGVLNSPYVNLSGEVIHKDGYNPRSGYFMSIKPSYAPGEKNLSKDDFEKLTNPTQADAAESYEWLRKEMLAEFPFVTEADAAVAVAYALTLQQKPAIDGPVPAFLASAPEQSTGKTILIAFLTALSVGVWPAPSAYMTDAYAMANFLISALAESVPAILFDNLPDGATIDNAEVSKVLTSPDGTYQGRAFHKQELKKVIVNTVLVFTGNNLTLAKDLTTRVYTMYLQTEGDDPDRRVFTRELQAWVKENRARYYYHTCRLLRAHKLHGAERVSKDVGRFTAWDANIRQPILWAGGADVDEVIFRAKQDDPEVEGRLTLFENWHSTFGDEWKTAAEVVGCYDLRDPILDVFPSNKSGDVSSKGFGHWLRKRKNQRFGGRYQLQVMDDSSSGAKVWRVKWVGKEENTPDVTPHRESREPHTPNLMAVPPSL
ncbi:MAG: hypothetical protein ACJAYC_002747 [Halieaceae bacterium]|jgi:hypothetical protein